MMLKYVYVYVEDSESFAESKRIRNLTSGTAEKHYYFQDEKEEKYFCNSKFSTASGLRKELKRNVRF